MKNKLLAVSSVILLFAVMAMFSACGEPEMTASSESKYEPPSEDCIMTVEESGWTYSEKDDCIYYAVIMKNNSAEYACSTPSVRVKIKDNQGKVISKEDLTLPEAGPGEKVAYGSVGKYSGKVPAEVTFKEIESMDWSQPDRGTESLAMDVIDAGVRDYVEEEEDTQEENSDDIDYEKEFDDIDKIFDDMDDDLKKDVEKETASKSKGNADQNDIDRNELMKDAASVEYYGKIVNDRKYDCGEVLVCILFRDEQGNLAGGENGTVNDVKAESETPFSIVSSSGISMPSYDFFAYQW